MLNIFNRQELVTIASQQKFFRIREALANAGIASHTKTHGILGAAAHQRARGFTPPRVQDAAYTYTVYVRREDYHRAVNVIQSALR